MCDNTILVPTIAVGAIFQMYANYLEFQLKPSSTILYCSVDGSVLSALGEVCNQVRGF
jgi:hypothetical protein